MFYIQKPFTKTSVYFFFFPFISDNTHDNHSWPDTCIGTMSLLSSSVKYLLACFKTNIVKDILKFYIDVDLKKQVTIRITIFNIFSIIE